MPIADPGSRRIPDTLFEPEPQSRRPWQDPRFRSRRAQATKRGRCARGEVVHSDEPSDGTGLWSLVFGPVFLLQSSHALGRMSGPGSRCRCTFGRGTVLPFESGPQGRRPSRRLSGRRARFTGQETRATPISAAGSHALARGEELPGRGARGGEKRLRLPDRDLLTAASGQHGLGLGAHLRERPQSRRTGAPLGRPGTPLWRFSRLQTRLQRYHRDRDHQSERRLFA